MAGELAIVETQPHHNHHHDDNDNDNYNNQNRNPITITTPNHHENTWEWTAEYSRCFTYPSKYLSSIPPNDNNNIDRRRFIPTWLTSAGPTTVSIHVSDHSPQYSILTVSFPNTLLEEHYVSKLHFVWPQVSCISTRGTLIVIASYIDSRDEKQKFALRFSAPSEIENFMTVMEDLLSNKLPKEASAVEVTSPISSQSEFIPPYRPDTSSMMNNIYASPDTSNFQYQNQEESQFQTQDIVLYSGSNDVAFPPSFTSLVSSCYAEPEQNELALALVPEPQERALHQEPALYQEPDLQSQIQKYMQDASFLDMVNKVNEVIAELGGDFAI